MSDKPVPRRPSNLRTDGLRPCEFIQIGKKLKKFNNKSSYMVHRMLIKNDQRTMMI